MQEMLNVVLILPERYNLSVDFCMHSLMPQLLYWFKKKSDGLVTIAQSYRALIVLLIT